MQYQVPKAVKKAVLKDLKAGELTRTAIADKHGVSRGTVYQLGKKLDKPAKADQSPSEAMEAENELLREEVRRARRQIKTSRKDSAIFNSIAGLIPERVVPHNAPKYEFSPPKKGAIQETLVLHLSDGHHDSIVNPEEVAGLENYNFEVSCRRAENFVDTALEWTLTSLAPNFHFTRLVILAYGDHTSGQIHDAERRSHFQNQFKNTLAIGQLHSMMFRDLSAHFEQVDVLYLPGNHGRTTTKKDHHGAHENWDYLVGKIAEQHCLGLENISFAIPNSFSANIEIEGHGFSVSHGDDIRGSMGIPFYGAQRRQKALQALSPLMKDTPRVRYAVMGHHHTQSSLQDFDGELLMNGAWLGTDAYAFNSFSGYREPCQLMHGVHKDQGVSWRLPIRLRSEDDVNGPKRYKVSL